MSAQNTPISFIGGHIYIQDSPPVDIGEIQGLNLGAPTVETAADRKPQVAGHQHGGKGTAMIPGIVSDAAPDL